MKRARFIKTLLANKFEQKVNGFRTNGANNLDK
jgi:hypothetical protein